MRLTPWAMCLSLVCAGLVSCSKKTPEPETDTATPAYSETSLAEALVPLPVTLPKQAFKWNVPSIREGVSNLEPPQVRPRPDFLAPVGVTNLALNKLVNVRQEVAQYVRLYSHGNNLNDHNHYLEVEVYGWPDK